MCLNTLGNVEPKDDNDSYEAKEKIKNSSKSNSNDNIHHNPMTTSNEEVPVEPKNWIENKFSKIHQRTTSCPIKNKKVIYVKKYCKNAKGLWMFFIEIQTSPYNVYTIRRRFSDVKKIHKHLSSIDASLPNLPPSSLLIVFRRILGDEKEMIDSRVEKLQEILNYILLCPSMKDDNEFIKFLGQDPSCRSTTGYVSLAEYSATNDMPLDLLRKERIMKRSMSAPACVRTVDSLIGTI